MTTSPTRTCLVDCCAAQGIVQNDGVECGCQCHEPCDDGCDVAGCYNSGAHGTSDAQRLDLVAGDGPRSSKFALGRFGAHRADVAKAERRIAARDKVLAEIGIDLPQWARDILDEADKQT